ncbi:hypothetical protein LCGC14_1052360 [marine sediment metagenome]|uniref:Uncharacterized protein n=1 Tax=marine sediment metagenome TaxID=412755 RepID=A0A0F9NAC0_9ZZZZ
MTLINDLKSFSNSDLETELERRERQKTKPEKKAVYVSDWFPLMDLCEYYINSLDGGDYFKDHEHYIFEKAIEITYGKGVWDWIRENENE